MSKSIILSHLNFHLKLKEAPSALVLVFFLWEANGSTSAGPALAASPASVPAESGYQSKSTTGDGKTLSTSATGSSPSIPYHLKSGRSKNTCLLYTSDAADEEDSVD